MPIDQGPRVRVVPTSHDPLRGNVYRDRKWVGYLVIRPQQDGSAHYYPCPPDPLHPRSPLPPTRWYYTMRDALVYLLRPERAKGGVSIPDANDYAYAQADNQPPARLLREVLASTFRDGVVEEGVLA